MSLDRLTLRACFDEIRPRLGGRRVEKVRPHGPSSLKLELSSRELLFLDVSRPLCGFFLLPRTARLPPDSREAQGPSRSSALLFKKHLEGARIHDLRLTPAGTSSLLTSGGEILLRTHASPAASLIVEASAIALFGSGERVVEESENPPGPTVAQDLATAWRLVREAGQASLADRRALVAARDPGLLPLLKVWPSSEAGQRRLAEVIAGVSPAAAFLSPPPGDDAANGERPPRLLPFEPDEASAPAADFFEAAARFYLIRRRAELFVERTRSDIAAAKNEVARLTRLKAALERDRGRWPDPAELRRQGEALLAAPAPSDGRDPDGKNAAAPGPGGSVPVLVPDPRTGERIEVRIDPRRSWPQNANALYARARNIDAQAGAFQLRWAATLEALEAAEARWRQAREVRSLEGCQETGTGERGASHPSGRRPRFLTTRGLEIHFGRSASENHEVTFKIARREDIWFHVLDAPGGHVVLRNSEGRATREDLEEAASVAAFLSERRTEGGVDVQYTERKHVHPAGGGKGRVKVTHAEVMRVTPKDPAGRLRAR